ncbi:MFS transporter, partial [Bryobacter aggregatus]|uniref:MFS transporter n=1 Tax=Bryobacter aggregatus TaxID=360054 RepID=UPI0004E0E67C
MNRWNRIIPAAFLMYTIAYIDRTNFSIAMPSLQKEFGLDSSMTGMAAGIFFIGYVLFQMPGGYLAQAWSAKRFIFWALLVWGVFATLCGFAQSYEQLLVCRFLLGVGEGGVWPATVVLLSNWFAPQERARANGFWVVCQPIAVILSSPLSGYLIDHYNWRVMFIVQGILPLFFAAVWWWAVEDRPEQAKWATEKSVAPQVIANANAGSRWDFLRYREVWLLVILDLAFACGAYGMLMWLPSTIRSLGLQNNLLIGLLSGFPYVFAVAGSIYNSRRSDRKNERRWHVAMPCMAAGIFLILGFLASVQLPVLGLLLICLTAAGIYAAIGPMWALMTEIVPKHSAGLSLGLINGAANLGGLAGPYLVGSLRDSSASFLPGFLFLGGSLITAGLFTLLLQKPKALSVR